MEQTQQITHESFNKVLVFYKNNKTAEIEIKYTDGVLSITGTVFRGHKLNKSESNLISCGQCLYDCRRIVPDQLLRVWERWHLNDMRAGTRAQELLLESVKDTFDHNDWYTAACDYLKSIDMYNHNGYEYGTKWLTEPVPSDVLEYLRSL